MLDSREIPLLNPATRPFFNHDKGLKQYELVNHLGNVLVVFDDRKVSHEGVLGKIGHYTMSLLNVQDYFPGGWMMPGRKYNNGFYRYKHQGQEGDGEIYGEGDAYHYTFRINDSRTNRFWSVDPLSWKFPYYSTYSYSGNRLIDAIEYEGLEPQFKDHFTMGAGYTMWGTPKTTAQKVTLEDIHTALDFYGCTPLVGELFDFANAIIYVFEGDYANAGYSVVAIVPLVGDAAAKGTKYTIKTFKSVDSAVKYSKLVELHGSEKIATEIWNAKTGELRKSLDAGGKGLDVPWQAHHVIPTELLEKNPIVKEAVEQGFDFNGATNGIALPASRHSGSHPNYTSFVESTIEDIKRNNPHMSSLEILNKAASAMKKEITSSTEKINEICR